MTLDYYTQPLPHVPHAHDKQQSNIAGYLVRAVERPENEHEAESLSDCWQLLWFIYVNICVCVYVLRNTLHSWNSTNQNGFNAQLCELYYSYFPTTSASYCTYSGLAHWQKPARKPLSNKYLYIQWVDFFLQILIHWSIY